MKLICTKSTNILDYKPDTKVCLNDNVVTVLGLAKQNYKDGLIYQWWIVEDDISDCCSTDVIMEVG